jgi:hypothetical protein
LNDIYFLRDNFEGSNTARELIPVMILHDSDPDTSFTEVVHSTVPTIEISCLVSPYWHLDFYNWSSIGCVW